MRAFTGLGGVMLLVYASLTAAAEPAPAKPDLARGQQIATTVCAACHGADGNSTNPMYPVLAGQHEDYIVTQLAAFKSGARPNPIMQGMAAGLSAEDMASVGAWFESRKPAPHFAHDKAMVQQGEKIWRGGVAATDVPACAGCHGAAGHGTPAQFPRLAGQHPELSFGWLKAFATGTRPNPVMEAIASKLTESQMKALAEYISGLR